MGACYPPPVPLPPAKSAAIDPAKYPPKPDANYQPPAATFADMRGVLRTLGLNDAETVELLYRYVDNDKALLQKILVDNPVRLHGFD